MDHHATASLMWEGDPLGS